MGIIDKVATAIVKDAAATAAIGALDAADKGVKAIGEKIDKTFGDKATRHYRKEQKYLSKNPDSTYLIIQKTNVRKDIFAGFVYCGDCLHAMARKAVPSHGKRYYYFVCSTHKAKQGCSPHSFSESKLEKIVFQLVRDQINLVCEVDAVLDYIASLPEQQRKVFDYDAQLTRLEDEIKRYQDLKLNLYSDMADGMISKEEYLEFRSGYDRRIQERQKAMVQIKEEFIKEYSLSRTELNWLRKIRRSDFDGLEGEQEIKTLHGALMHYFRGRTQDDYQLFDDPYVLFKYRNNAEEFIERELEISSVECAKEGAEFPLYDSLCKRNYFSD